MRVYSISYDIYSLFCVFFVCAGKNSANRDAPFLPFTSCLLYTSLHQPVNDPARAQYALKILQGFIILRVNLIEDRYQPGGLHKIHALMLRDGKTIVFFLRQRFQRDFLALIAFDGRQRMQARCHSVYKLFCSIGDGGGHRVIIISLPADIRCKPGELIILRQIALIARHYFCLLYTSRCV